MMIIIPKHGTLTFEQCAQILTLSQRNYGPFILPNETAQERNTRHEENRNIMREAIANGKLDTVILDFDENEIKVVTHLYVTIFFLVSDKFTILAN